MNNNTEIIKFDIIEKINKLRRRILNEQIKITYTQFFDGLWEAIDSEEGTELPEGCDLFKELDSIDEEIEREREINGSSNKPYDELSFLFIHLSNLLVSINHDTVMDYYRFIISIEYFAIEFEEYASLYHSLCKLL